MKSKIPGLLIVGLLAGPIAAQATVNFSTDTATDLVGTFSVTGTSADSATPGVFDFGLCLHASPCVTQHDRDRDRWTAVCRLSG
jgi:hypothetical protein